MATRQVEQDLKPGCGFKMPKVVDHDERRRDIAHAVLRVVAEVGVRGANIRSVATEAGYSAGVINYYFDDKQALLVGALREAAQTVGDRMRGIQRRKTGVERVRALAEAGMPVDEERAATCRIFYHFSAEGMADASFRQELAQYYVWWRSAVEAAIREAQQLELFPAFDARELSESVVGLAEGLGIQGLFDAEAMPPGRMRRRLRDIIERFALMSPASSDRQRIRD